MFGRNPEFGGCCHSPPPHPFGLQATHGEQQPWGTDPEPHLLPCRPLFLDPTLSRLVKGCWVQKPFSRGVYLGGCRTPSPAPSSGDPQCRQPPPSLAPS